MLFKIPPSKKTIDGGNNTFGLINKNVYLLGLRRMNFAGSDSIAKEFQSKESDALEDDHSTIDKNLTDKCDT